VHSHAHASSKPLTLTTTEKCSRQRSHSENQARWQARKVWKERVHRAYKTRRGNHTGSKCLPGAASIQTCSAGTVCTRMSRIHRCHEPTKNTTGGTQEDAESDSTTHGEPAAQERGGNKSNAHRATGTPATGERGNTPQGTRAKDRRPVGDGAGPASNEANRGHSDRKGQTGGQRGSRTGQREDKTTKSRERTCCNTNFPVEITTCCCYSVFFEGIPQPPFCFLGFKHGTSRALQSGICQLSFEKMKQSLLVSWFCQCFLLCHAGHGAPLTQRIRPEGWWHVPTNKESQSRTSICINGISSRWRTLSGVLAESQQARSVLYHKLARKERVKDEQGRGTPKRNHTRMEWS
jgi:hypothetical protein